MDTKYVGRPGQGEVYRILSHIPAVRRCDGCVSNEQVREHESEADEEQNHMADITMMYVVNDRVFFLAALLIRDSAEVQNFHVNQSCGHAHSIDMNFHERLLEHVSEQVPIFFREGPGS